MKQMLFSLFLLGGLQPLSAQFFPKNQAQADSLYKVNITKSRINGVYIPRDLSEVYQELKDLSTPEATLKFQMGEEDVVARKLFFGIGRWMKVNWNLEQGSRISKVLKDQGILRVDDMVDALIRLYHRHLNDKAPDIDGLAEMYEKKWNDIKMQKFGDGTVISTQKKERPE